MLGKFPLPISFLWIIVFLKIQHTHTRVLLKCFCLSCESKSYKCRADKRRRTLCDSVTVTVRFNKNEDLYSVFPNSIFPVKILICVVEVWRNRVVIIWYLFILTLSSGVLGTIDKLQQCKWNASNVCCFVIITWMSCSCII